MHLILCFFLSLSSLTFKAFAKWIPEYQKKVEKIDKGEHKYTLEDLKMAYKIEYKSKDALLTLQTKSLRFKEKAVPVLIEVMKDDKLPDKNRWMATFLLGKIMGQGASPLISKYLVHPYWVMRMASLKTLLALKEKNYGELYADKLRDDSMIIRIQALENIRYLKLSKQAQDVWKMLYRRENYQDVNGKSKRTSIIKKIIRTVGELKFQEAKVPMLKMISSNRYDDIFQELDYSLSKLTDQTSPEKGKEAKRYYWKRFLVQEQKI